ncbi:MAG TPA: LON peptidase substrate-binding domain-containing protein, partial [Methanospirillum sp.]|nr:LON peptidase substrate-binding domain-containing protein [Methanospirillum sp.]
MTDTDTPPHEEHQELPLLPLMNTVIFPKTRTKILVDEETGHMLMKDANRPESTLFIGATVHPDTDASEISQDTIYPVGNLLEISYIHKTGEGYMLGVSARDRIRITSVRSDDDRLYACYTPAPDLHDIDDDGVRELLHEIKQVVYDIGSAFQGSDHILGPV